MSYGKLIINENELNYESFRVSQNNGNITVEFQISKEHNEKMIQISTYSKVNLTLYDETNTNIVYQEEIDINNKTDYNYSIEIVQNYQNSLFESRLKLAYKNIEKYKEQFNIK